MGKNRKGLERKGLGVKVKFPNTSGDGAGVSKRYIVYPDFFPVQKFGVG